MQKYFGASPKDQQRSYWINLYNAGTVQLILQNLPVKSIQNINFSDSSANGPWAKKLFKVEGQQLSLDVIAHLRTYADVDLAARIAKSTKISGYESSCALNGA